MYPSKKFDIIKHMIDVVRISKALGDPIRHKILLMLVNYRECTSPLCHSGMGGVCNCDIMEEFGMIQSRVSYHMKELSERGLVTEVQQGKWRYYFLNKDTLKDYIEELGVNFQL